MTLQKDGTHLEGITPGDGKNSIRCLECGAFKSETPGEWYIQDGIIECPSCKQ